MKQSAKDAGVETNIRVVEATATNLLPKFTTEAASMTAFDTAMVDKLNGNVKNPFTQSESVVTGDLLAEGTSSIVGAYGYTTHTNGDNSGDPAGSATNKNKKGVVVWNVYTSGSALQCDVWGYDGSGFRSEVHSVN